MFPVLPSILPPGQQSTLVPLAFPEMGKHAEILREYFLEGMFEPQCEATPPSVEWLVYKSQTTTEVDGD